MDSSWEVNRQRLIHRIAVELTHKLIVDGAMQSCLNCYHFNEKDEICGKYQMRPPARVIVTSCPEWEDEIPF